MLHRGAAPLARVVPPPRTRGRATRCTAATAVAAVAPPASPAPRRRLHRCSAAGGDAAPSGAAAASASGGERAAPRAGSLIEDTLAALSADAEQQAGLRRLREQGQAALTRQESARRRRALSLADAPSFDALLASRAVPPLRHGRHTTLQVNIGLFCNQACSHCHVESSPLRVRENMDGETVDAVLRVLRASPGVRTLDITGGAPELNPHFRRLVRGARALGLEVIDRCNLTVMFEDGQADLAAFLAEQSVRVVASLPCYSAATVDAQRGDGVFERSIAALRELNAVGYAAAPDNGLHLDLMYNPAGASLPPDAATLEAAYKRELAAQFGVSFSSLLTLTNMPIKRFADRLHQRGETEAYMQLLLAAFNPAAAARVMCTGLVSVRWDGALFDCDFNQQLDIGMRGASAAKRSIFGIASLEELEGCDVATDLHCLGCTAGAGSSCGGQLA
jgi:radical SAM/Cys-rich protein